MKLKPLGRRVVLKKKEREPEEEEGGIILPAEAKDESYIRAEVMAVGTNDKIEVKEGDEVIFSGFSGTELTVGGEELTIVKDNDILAVVE